MSKKLNISAIQDELSGVSSFYHASHPAKEVPQKQKIDTTHSVAQNRERKLKQVSKPSSRGVSKWSSNAFKQEDVELLAFELRKVRKVKLNTEVPEDWKDKLDTLAHQLKIGKYDLLMYIIGLFLEEVKPEQTK